MVSELLFGGGEGCLGIDYSAFRSPFDERT